MREQKPVTSSDPIYLISVNFVKYMTSRLNQLSYKLAFPRASNCGPLPFLVGVKDLGRISYKNADFNVFANDSQLLLSNFWDAKIMMITWRQKANLDVYQKQSLDWNKTKYIRLIYHVMLTE